MTHRLSVRSSHVALTTTVPSAFLSTMVLSLAEAAPLLPMTSAAIAAVATTLRASVRFRMSFSPGSGPTPLVDRAQGSHRWVEPTTGSAPTLNGIGVARSAGVTLGWMHGDGQAGPGHVRLRGSRACGSLLVRGARLRGAAPAAGFRLVGRVRPVAAGRASGLGVRVLRPHGGGPATVLPARPRGQGRQEPGPPRRPGRHGARR